MLLITGDMNVKVGTDKSNYERARSTHREGTICLKNNLVIGETIYPHKNIHKLTWKSPNGKIQIQPD